MGTRIENFDKKYVVADIKTILDKRLQSMISGQRVRLPELQALEKRVKAVCTHVSGTDTVTANLLPFYHAFSRQAFAAMKTHAGGNTLDIEIAALVAKYTADGLKGTTLNTILSVALGYRAP